MNADEEPREGKASRKRWRARDQSAPMFPDPPGLYIRFLQDQLSPADIRRLKPILEILQRIANCDLCPRGNACKAAIELCPLAELVVHVDTFSYSADAEFALMDKIKPYVDGGADDIGAMPNTQDGTETETHPEQKEDAHCIPPIITAMHYQKVFERVGAGTWERGERKHIARLVAYLDSEPATGEERDFRDRLRALSSFGLDYLGDRAGRADIERRNYLSPGEYEALEKRVLEIVGLAGNYLTRSKQHKMRRLFVERLSNADAVARKLFSSSKRVSEARSRTRKKLVVYLSKALQEKAEKAERFLR